MNDSLNFFNITIPNSSQPVTNFAEVSMRQMVKDLCQGHSSMILGMIVLALIINIGYNISYHKWSRHKEYFPNELGILTINQCLFFIIFFLLL